MSPAARLISLLVILASQNIVWAQSVGRAKVADLPAGWTELIAYDSQGLSLNGGQKRMPMQGMAFLSPSRHMLLIVESTLSGNSGRNVDWVTMKCPPMKDGYFSNDYGTNQNSRDTRCLVVNARYADKKYLAMVSPPTAEAAEKAGLRFDKGQLIRTWTGIKSGSYLRLYLFTTSAFAPATTAGKEEATGVDQALIAFGESLQKLVHDSTLSVSGNLSLQLLNTIK